MDIWSNVQVMAWITCLYCLCINIACIFSIDEMLIYRRKTRHNDVIYIYYLMYDYIVIILNVILWYLVQIFTVKWHFPWMVGGMSGIQYTVVGLCAGWPPALGYFSRVSIVVSSVRACLIDWFIATGWRGLSVSVDGHLTGGI